MQHIFRTCDVNLEPCVLHAVQCIMFHSCHKVLLHALCQRSPKRAQQDWILAVRFLNTSPSRMPRQINTNPAKEIRTKHPPLLPNSLANSLLKINIPRRASSHADGEARCTAHDHPARPVSKPVAWDRQAGEGAVDVGSCMMFSFAEGPAIMVQ